MDDTEKTLARWADEFGSANTLFDVGETLTPHKLAARRAPATQGPLFGSLPALSLRLPDGPDLGRVPPTEGSDLELRSLLAEGGMGRLFVAEQRSLGREVVVKTVKDASSREQRGALVQEGGIMGTLEHPNIIPVHQLGTDTAGRPVLVMKRIVGVPLSSLVADDGDAGWRRHASGLHGDRNGFVVEVLIQVCRALEWAHARGFIHRDVKPENIMIGDAGEVYLADWGIACRAHEGADGPLVGTPSFLAPEMVTQAYLGPETDVFLLGATLHAALTLTPRHMGDDVLTAVRNALQCGPVVYPPEVPGELGELANRATARSPQDRPRSAAEFRAGLSSYLAHRGANQLCAEAEAKLAELETVRQGSHLADVRIARLGAEARFGFEAALRQWPEGSRPLAGRARCIETLVHIELDRRNVEAAEALAGELEPISDALAARIQEVRASLVRESEEAAALREAVREGDARVGARGRAMFAALLLVIAVAVSTLVLVTDTVPTPGTLLVIGSVMIGFSFVTFLLMRRTLLQNRFGFNVAGVVAGSMVLLMIHRVGAYWVGSPVASTFVGDAAILAVAVLALGLFGERRWLWGVLPLAAGALFSGSFPDMAPHGFSVGASLALAVIAIDMLRGARDGGS